MTSVSGPSLTFESVTRAQAASYLCIASNGVPPSVSKRVDLRVQCRSSLDMQTIHRIGFHNHGEGPY